MAIRTFRQASAPSVKYDQFNRIVFQFDTRTAGLTGKEPLATVNPSETIDGRALCDTLLAAGAVEV